MTFRVPGHRRHAMWLFFALHRASGLALAAFLPAHFLVLSLALTNPAAFADTIAWTRQPAVKAAEVALVFLLAVHLLGGLRLLALELLPWRDWQKTLAALAAASAAFVACVFLLSAA